MSMHLKSKLSSEGKGPYLFRTFAASSTRHVFLVQKIKFLHVTTEKPTEDNHHEDLSQMTSERHGVWQQINCLSADSLLACQTVLTLLSVSDHSDTLGIIVVISH